MPWFSKDKTHPLVYVTSVYYAALLVLFARPARARLIGLCLLAVCPWCGTSLRRSEHGRQVFLALYNVRMVWSEPGTDEHSHGSLSSCSALRLLCHLVPSTSMRGCSSTLHVRVIGWQHSPTKRQHLLFHLERVLYTNEKKFAPDHWLTSLEASATPL